MAGSFRQLTLGAAQTAYQVAGRVIAGLASSGSITDYADATAELHTMADEILHRLRDVIALDNEFLEAQEAKAPAGGGSNWNSGPPKFNFGAFKGSTIEEVAAMSTDAAGEAAKANGKEYSRSGMEYLEWLTEKDKHPSREFMRKQAQEYFNNIKAGV